MIKREAKFGILFRAWWRSNRISGAFELKDTRGADSISFSEVGEEQINSGKANKSKKGNLIRAQSGTDGTADYIGLVSFPSYIVIKYPLCFCIIDVEVFENEAKESIRRSLTKERAKQIAFIVVDTKK